MVLAPATRFAGRSVGDGGDVRGREKVSGIVIFDAGLREERTRFSVKAAERETAVLRVNVYADGVAAGVEGGEYGVAGAGEGVEDRVATGFGDTLPNSISVNGYGHALAAGFSQ
jgi:hypothetical protein